MIRWLSSLHGCSKLHTLYADPRNGKRLRIFQSLQDFREGCTELRHPSGQSQEEECKVRRSFLLAALKGCSSIRDLETGKLLHSDASLLLNSDIGLANTVLNMYAKCGSMVEACSVFERIEQHSAVSWIVLMTGYVENGKPEVALEIFLSLMQSQKGRCSYAPNCRFYVPGLMACASLTAKEEWQKIEGRIMKPKCLQIVMAIHSRAVENSCDSDIYIASILVDVYAKCGSLCEARKVFDGMQQHNVVTWTSLIMGYASSGEFEEALDLLERMKRSGCKADALTYVAALTACAGLAAEDSSSGEEIVGGKPVKLSCLEKGMQIHSQARESGYESNIFVGSSLVDMYAKCGSILDARMGFDRMPRHDVVTWNALLLGYVHNGEEELALELFHQMLCGRGQCLPNARTFVAALMACVGLAEKQEDEEDEKSCKSVKVDCLEKGMKVHSVAVKYECDSDSYVASTLVDMYTKCRSMIDARLVFDKAKHRDVIMWTALILGYAENGDGEVALYLFARMREDGVCLPNPWTYSAALVACSSLSNDSGTTRGILRDIYRLGIERDSFVANSLVNFYARCGRMADSELVFNSVCSKSLVIWNALVAGYSRQGDTKHVFRLFQNMLDEGVQVNGITVLSILTVCSHAGLVERGKQMLGEMLAVYNVRPGIQHYHCVIDMLGRAGLLEDALEVVRSMPFDATVRTWTILLGGCWKWKNVKIGRAAFDALVQLDEKQTSGYVLMANIYESAGLQEELEAMKVHAVEEAFSS